MNVFSKVFGTRSQREVKRIMPLVEKTESYQSQMQQLTDEQLRDKTREYKKRLAEGETLDDYEDIYLAFMVLCQDAYDNRAYVADGTAANRVVCSILDMHARNLI